ncbi:MAG: hypothetical protein HETSPECPRED_005850 [Heterodermia speciosa]|uniref:Uncharacterized protein n=1 Tax=Heterodermia speciosa TaxID=116794 RepID=A0A8H3FME5_9LECA|nr:MAG: hypothetical protein HETSPECPRED_005850 [Heterodermia speciosa]
MLPSPSHRTRCLLQLCSIFLFLTKANSNLAGATCYDYDGTIQPGDVPCNPDAGQSFCCGGYWTCLGNGVCSDQNTTQLIGSGQTLLARATCTDPTFGSTVCPQFCLGDLGRGITTFANNDSFCCQHDLDQPCHQDPKIKTLELGAPFTTVSIPASTSRSSSSSSSTTTSKTSRSRPQTAAASTTTTSSKQGSAAESTSQKLPSSVAATSTPTSTPASGGLSEGAKIGLAVGITIVAISLLAALLFFWFRRRERRKKSAAELATHESQPVTTSQPSPLKGYYAGMGQVPQELGDEREKYSMRGELAAGEGAGRAEMRDAAGEKLAGSQRRPLELA